MELLNNIIAIIKSNTMNRKVDLPNDMKGYVTLDANSHETIVVQDEFDFRTMFKVAALVDIVEFAKALPLRYGSERAALYRELYIHVDGNDIPVRVSLADQLDKRDKAGISFDYKDHRDFTRWMNAKNMTQLEFRTLLLELAEQHDQPDLANILSIIKYKTEIEYEASVETERNFKLAFSENEIQGSVEIPKLITVNCPVISGAAHRERIVFEVVIRKPKNAEEKIKFSLISYGKDALMIRRDAAIEVTQSEFIMPVQNALSEFTQTLPAMFIREDPTPLVFKATEELAYIKK